MSEESSFTDWFTLDSLDTALQAEHVPIPILKDFLKTCHQTLEDRFSQGQDIESLVRARSWLMDQVLARLWTKIIGSSDNALVAVGGYGRNELLPGSDIDLMVLLDKTETPQLAEQLESLFLTLWDIGLEVGHSVRTLADCEEQSRNDITVATNLMEARLLSGAESLFENMRKRVGPDQVWPSKDFFAAKLNEQHNRYHRFDDAVYNLEPNVKEGPGGLRDVQMIGWIMKRHFGLDDLAELVEQNYLTQNEYQTIYDGQHFLWKVRFGLHSITGRREDRLLFEHQRTLASKFGYTDHDHKIAVEWFMKDYYQTIMEFSRLNEMLLQLFKELILYADDSEEPVNINRRFQTRKGFLEVVDDGVFDYNPFALLELFLIMQQHPEIKGVRATTIRLIRNRTHLIDEEFRNDIRARSLFMEIFRQPMGLTHELRRMNRYGVLAAYYPVFAHIVGQMQHDLFHVYTVDEHTLFLIRNLRRFMTKEFEDEFPLCSRISHTIPKPELLFLAGFFHDIAKGRGGNHAELGAEEALVFLRKHQLSEYDCELVSWIVRSHLLMSNTAQKKDISDPEVINEFAGIVGNTIRLDYLYLLTVADIRATSPTLWNNWRASLLQSLYNATKHALKRGLESPLLREEQIRDIKASALSQLIENGFEKQRMLTLWSEFPEDYFIRHSAEEVAWHAQVIYLPGHQDGIRVDLKTLSGRGNSELFVYAPITEGIFSRTAALLEQMGLSITDARILSTSRDYTLNTWSVLDNNEKPITDKLQIDDLISRIKHELELVTPSLSPVAAQIAPRRIRQFQVATRVHYELDESAQRTILELVTTDSPGLLSRIGQIFYSRNISLHNAKITTYGERAEDVFYLTGESQQPLTSLEKEELQIDLVETLDNVD